jgi:hypothetical protein
MATNKHPKLELARRMLTPDERARGITPFNSSAWQTRKMSIELRVKRLLERTAARKKVLERKAARGLFARV